MGRRSGVLQRLRDLYDRLDGGVPDGGGPGRDVVIGEPHSMLPEGEATTGTPVR